MILRIHQTEKHAAGTCVSNILDIVYNYNVSMMGSRDFLSISLVVSTLLSVIDNEDSCAVCPLFRNEQ